MHFLWFIGILAIWGGATAYEEISKSKKNSQNTSNYIKNLQDNTIGKSPEEIRKWLRKNR
jgi:hypothetical protein